MLEKKLSMKFNVIQMAILSLMNEQILPHLISGESKPSPFSSYYMDQSHLHAKKMSSEMTTENGNCLGWAAGDASGVLSPFKFNRRNVEADNVSIKITHCGVFYAEVIGPRNKHGNATYPMVPGHEIAGIVQDVGPNVHRFKVGDHIGVGTYTNSCRDYDNCNDGLEVYCDKGAVFTYNRFDYDGTITRAGFSTFTVVHERYCFKIPEDYPLASAAPLLCAGITVYSLMMDHKINKPGKSLGVIGLGGLGHMAVKFGKGFGLKVTVFSTSPSKKDEALTLLAADNFVVSSDQDQMTAMTKSLDFIIDTASGNHPIEVHMSQLKTAGVLVVVGAPSEIKLSPVNLITGKRSITGSAAGGTKQIQEMIDFCAAHKIYPNIEVVPIQYVNEAIERLIKKDVKYRFVIDIENSVK